MNKTLEDFTALAHQVDPNFGKHPVRDDPGQPLSPEEVDRMCTDYFRYLEVSHMWENVHEMVDKDPERVWPLLVEMVERAPSDDVRSSIAAGPLEDLIRWHSERFVDRLERQTLLSRHFHAAMRGVWGWDELSEPVRDRLFAVLTPDWDDLEERRAAVR